jgi:hypothetical protein
MGSGLKALYLVAAAVFYISVPVAPIIDRVVFMVRGYDTGIVFMRRDGSADGETIARFYDARRSEARIIATSAWCIVAFWGIVFFWSLYMMRKGVVLPLRLEMVTAVLSALILVITLGPMVVFGRGWPPRAF